MKSKLSLDAFLILSTYSIMSPSPGHIPLANKPIISNLSGKGELPLRYNVISCLVIVAKNR
ncbi:hypothetical protein SAMN05660226_01366 [Parapedobacter luteus]|uniref:Uncharacterized protein n=1 Tax=Parapedobacter luteus TaxID=623280 RepID=A0A1T5BCZ0_9SPHI|nr:hypothetical protein SAMN05660226_01366 [Parapedobacter luteus]